jgi:hypothetical protein
MLNQRSINGVSTLFSTHTRKVGLFFIVSLFLLCLIPGRCSSAEDKVFLYSRWKPAVIFNDGVSSTTLEVHTTGVGIENVSLAYGNRLLLMYDDGTHGDASPGDGVYTLNGITFKCPSSSLWFNGYYTYGFEILIRKTSGEEERCYGASLGIADVNQKFLVTKFTPQLSATEYAFFIVDSEGKIFPGFPLTTLSCGKTFPEAYKKFYSIFPDMFDILVVMPCGNIYNPKVFSENIPYCVNVKNNISNIGLTLFDDTAGYGSAGRLMSVIYHSFGTGAILDHETGHTWGINYGENLGLIAKISSEYSPHWYNMTDLDDQMQAFAEPSASYPEWHRFANNGDGTFRVVTNWETEQADYFSMLTLYLMGLVPSSEVPPVHILVNPNYSNPQHVTAESVKTITIEQLMAAEGGERVPTYPNTQKSFNMAFIIVSDSEFTEAEYTYFSLMAKFFGSKAPGEHYLIPFYNATRGKGSMNTYLPTAIEGTQAIVWNSSCSCGVSSSSIKGGSGITVTGTLNPALSNKTVTLTYMKPDGSALNRTVVTDQNGTYADSYIPTEAGSWSVKASWKGDSTHAGASSSSVSFTVSKISSTISCSVSSTSTSIGSSLIASGSITPVRSGVTVTLSYTMPNATVLTRIVTSASDGKYSDTYTPPVLGSWSVKASWEGDSTCTGATSSSVSFTVSKISSSISCSVSSSSPTIGDSATVSGSITPACSGVTVTISCKNDGSFSTLSTVTTASDGSYAYSWKPASVGSYQLKASWAGDSTYDGATSDAVSVTVNKISSSISCTASSSEITSGDSITVSGSISPSVSGKTVTLTYTKPDGTTLTRTVATGSDGSYSDSYKPDATGSWSVKVAWDGDSEHTGASSQSATFNVKTKSCIIATATYGSELSPEVQFLREFRDNTVLNTFAGSNFMTVFNVFYYSFSPSVASIISGNEVLRDAMKVILYPLIGILHLSSAAFSLFSFSPELGVVMAGLVASSLIAMVYFTPWALLFSFLKKLMPSARSIRLTGLVWAGSVVAMALAEAATSSPLMMASTGAFVLVTICLTTLASTRALTKRYIKGTR